LVPGKQPAQTNYQPQMKQQVQSRPPVPQQQPAQARPQVQTQSQSQFQQPASREEITVDEAGSFQMETVENKEAIRPQKPPKDWLRPKIFKGGSGGLV
jgi:hypothetical protein